MTIEMEKLENLGEFLEHQGFSDDAIDAYFLEHHGVTGMKWGVRKANRQRNKELNRVSRAKDKEKRVADIDKARARIQGGKQHAELQKAKAQFKVNKQELGSREARKILNKTREKHWNEQQVAQQARDGKEVALGLVVALGAIAVGAALGATNNR